MPAKKTYSVVEAAKRLKVSRAAIYEAITKGALEAEKVIVKAEYRIPAKALRSYKVSLLHKQLGKKSRR